MEKYLSIVIPNYNEEKRISNTIKKIKDFFNNKNISFEIIFVNDGSNDKTIEIINKEAVSLDYKILNHSKNMGKGKAIKTGMLNAKGNWILFMDADFSTPIEEIENFIPLMNQNYNVLIGSRKMKGSYIEKRQNFFREFLGKCFTFFSNFILNTKYTDFTCGFKIFDKKSTDLIFNKQTINNWSYDSEILFLVNKFNLKFKEIPVKWKNDPNTKVKLSRDILGSLYGILRIRYNDLFKTYE